jgi:hypothetical protein
MQSTHIQSLKYALYEKLLYIYKPLILVFSSRIGFKAMFEYMVNLRKSTLIINRHTFNLPSNCNVIIGSVQTASPTAARGACVKECVSCDVEV